MMAIQTVEAWIHSVHRNFTDVIVFLVIGRVLLALLPAKREAVHAATSRVRPYRSGRTKMAASVLQAPATIHALSQSLCILCAETGLPSLPIKGWLKKHK
jgi:hypothetical protein